MLINKYRKKGEKKRESFFPWESFQEALQEKKTHERVHVFTVAFMIFTGEWVHGLKCIPDKNKQRSAELWQNCGRDERLPKSEKFGGNTYTTTNATAERLLMPIVSLESIQGSLSASVQNTLLQSDTGNCFA